jgi:hypothetical protein
MARDNIFLKRLPGVRWGANPGPFDFIYFLSFHHLTAEPQRLPKARDNIGPTDFLIQYKYY